MRIGDRAAAAGRRRDDPMGEEAKYLETARADRSVWLMKCPPVVSRAWQAASASSSSDAANPNPVVAKVVLSLDLPSGEEQQEPSLQASPLSRPLRPLCFKFDL